MSIHRGLSIGFACAALAIGSGAAQAAVTSPYGVDASTLHLWHMDEANPGPAQPAAGVAGSFALTPVNGAVLGQPGALGFGTAGNTVGATNRAFQGASIPVSSVTGANGAFTYEMLINTSTITALQELITMDNAGVNSARPFLFRVAAAGALQFTNISDPAGVQSLNATIPTTGDNAFVADKWFHVAVTYDGNANTANNMNFYWTRLEDYNTQANLIGSANMRADLGGVATVLGVGNEFRSTPDNSLRGPLDEVRISSSVRAANQFLFAADSNRLLFQDRFNDDNIANTASQSGSVAPLAYTAVSGTFAEANGVLTITPTTSGSLTPNHNFNTADIVRAGGFNIQLTDVNPVVGGNGTSINWLGVSMFRAAAGDGGAAPDVTASPFGILFRDDGGFTAFSNGVTIGTGSFISPGGLDLLYDLRIDVALDSFNASDSARVAVFLGDDANPFFSTLLSGLNLSNNFITFEARNSAATVGNIRIALNNIPEPASALLLVIGGLLAGRRRSALRAA